MAPRRVQVSAEVRVAVPAERAFRELVDAEGQQRWMFGTTIYPVAGTAASPEVGCRLVAFTGAFGLGVLDTMVVTEYRQGERWVVEHLGRVIKGSGIFEVRTVDDRHCLVSWTEDLLLPFGLLGRIGWPIVRPAVGWGLRVSMRRFQRLLQAGG